MFKLNEIKSIHKEDISTAYLKLLAASSDITKISMGNRDHDGVDCELLIEKIEDFDIKNVKISVQVKASINVKEQDDSNLYFDLPVKNYNKFCGKAFVPKIFAILQLPEEKKWVDFDGDLNHLLVRNKMYWYIIPKGTPESTNRETVRISIPKNNFWTAENFRTICSDLVKDFYAEENELEAEK